MIVILIAILLSLNSGLSKILNKKAVQESILKGKSSTTKLVFCRENIDFIEPDSFYGKYEVTILEIPYNKLRNLKGDLLRDTRKLEEANFADNTIELIDRNFFSGLKNLQTLGIPRNRLTNFDSEIFNELVSLKKLDLSSNQLEYIDEIIFANLKNLKILNLSANKLKSIHTNCFANLRNLKELSLDRNQLTQLNKNVFRGLSKLKRLLLYYNQLTSVDDLFTGLNSVELISANNNLIRSLARDTFQNLGNLTWLDLSNNKISIIDSDAFSGTCNISTFKLANNSFYGKFSYDKCNNLNGNVKSKIQSQSSEKDDNYEEASGESVSDKTKIFNNIYNLEVYNSDRFNSGLNTFFSTSGNICLLFLNLLINLFIFR